MSTTADKVERVIHGHLQGVEMRNAGWHRFSIMEPGNQYATRVDTKKKTLIDQCMALMNADVSAEIMEQESTNINEHTGEPYTNRYINSIAAQGMPMGTSPPETTTGMQVVQEAQARNVAAQNVVQPGASGYEKDLTIWRQTASKVVTASLDVLPEDQRNVEGMIKACEVWVAYYQHGPYRFGIRPASENINEAAYKEARPEEGFSADDPASEEAFIQSLGTVTEGEPCPDCGFTGTHALGCPRADYA